MSRAKRTRQQVCLNEWASAREGEPAAALQLEPLALVAAGIGDHEAALQWLEQAFDEHAHWMETLRIFPPFDPLRDEPRFEALVAKMRFP